MDYNLQPNYSTTIYLEQTKILSNQMEHSICKIYYNEKQYGNGFFCNVPFCNNHNTLPVLISNNSAMLNGIIKLNKKIQYSLNNDNNKDILSVDDDRIIYINYDTIIIEIRPYDKLNSVEFLEIDDRIYYENPNEIFLNSPIYLLFYDNTKKVGFSYSSIANIGDFLEYFSNDRLDKSGCPILSLNTFKLIGINGNVNINMNIKSGTFIKPIINQFYILNQYKTINKYNKIITYNKSEQSNKSNDVNDEIIISYKISRIQNNNLYGIENNFEKRTKEKLSKNKLFGERFVENNKNKCKIIINGKEKELCTFYNFDNMDENQIFTIKLKGINNIDDISFMFCGCLSLFSLPDISKWNTEKVTNMSCIFCGCYSLKSLPKDLSQWNTSNCVSFNGMFYGCYNLKYLPDISNWDTNKIIDIRFMFQNCKCLLSLPDISKWNLNNIQEINNIFFECNSLISLPDISKWKTEKISDMNSLFYGCKSLTFLPDISKWNTEQVTNLGTLFQNCQSLLYLPDISKWKTNKVTNMNGLFYGCKSLSYLPDISKWNTSNVDNFGFMFYGCSSLVYLPNISKWDISSAGRIDSMFQNCISLLKFPDLSRWKTYKSLQIIYIFDKCISALSFPTIKQSFFNQFNWT